MTCLQIGSDSFDSICNWDHTSWTLFSSISAKRLCNSVQTSSGFSRCLAWALNTLLHEDTDKNIISYCILLYFYRLFLYFFQFCSLLFITRLLWQFSFTRNGFVGIWDSCKPNLNEIFPIILVGLSCSSSICPYRIP